MEKKLNILVLDDHRLWLKTLKESLEERNINVSTAVNIEEADALLSKKKFDAALIDVNLGKDVPSGIKVARRYRKAHPSTAIILFTGVPLNYYDYTGDIPADDCLDKTVSIEALEMSIISAVWKKRMPVEMREKRAAILQKLEPYKNAIRFKERTGDETGAERIEGILVKDATPLAWGVYNLPQTNSTRNVVCLAATVGCVGKCLFCGSRKRPFVRKLEVSEIIAQFLHGLDSYHLRSQFESLQNEAELVVNLTCEGDAVVSNLDNCCQAFEQIIQLEMLSPSLIMTTIGHERNLIKFLSEYSHLPITFYWSLNFLDAVLRAKFMHGTEGESLIRQRNIFQKIAEKTGQPITVSWIVMAGVNDRLRDAELLAEYFGGRPFEIKLMALEPNSIPGIETTNEDVDIFMLCLQAAGLSCRRREIVGGQIRAGCGTTIPFDIDVAKREGICL